MPLAGAAGRVLAADAVATIDLPPFPSSAMDGFACARPTRGDAARRRARSRGHACAARARRGRGDGDRDGGRRAGGSRCRHPRRVCCPTLTTTWRSRRPVRSARTFARAAATCAQATWSFARARALRCSGRRACRSGHRSRRVHRAPARRRPHHGQRAAQPGDPLAPRPARSTRRTASCSAPRWRVPAQPSSRSPPSPTTRTRIARRSSGGSRRTCSSPPAVSRSDHTTWSGASRPTSVSRRCSGALP